MTATYLQSRAIIRYIDSLRSPAKRAYAAAYVMWSRQGRTDGEEPDAGKLSYMGAQAVRLRIAELLS